MKLITALLLACAIALEASAVAADSPTGPSAAAERQHVTYLVQAASVAAARKAVEVVGGRVVNELTIIDAVGADLDAGQLARIEAMQTVRT
jgi:hypothetical protein